MTHPALKRHRHAAPSPAPQPHPDFFNTTGIGGAELEFAIRKTHTQAACIANFFRHRSTPCSPREVHRLLGGDSTMLLTSVRRAMTQLEQAGVLERTTQIRGAAGAKEWRYAHTGRRGGGHE